jgi:hypothetical protein
MDFILNNLAWIEELLPPGYHSMPKHGGMAYYYEGKLVLILVERRDTYEHKDVTYPFELWNGCIFPIKKIAQNAFFLKYLFLENHPANKDWLYIPADREDFEDEVKQMMREIAKSNPLLGIQVKFEKPPKSEDEKKPVKKKTPAKAKASKKSENAFFLSIAKQNKK